MVGGLEVLVEALEDDVQGGEGLCAKALEAGGIVEGRWLEHESVTGEGTVMFDLVVLQERAGLRVGVTQSRYRSVRVFHIYIVLLIYIIIYLSLIH